jgi:GNAT superfamily N-acetyltransferase
MGDVTIRRARDGDIDQILLTLRAALGETPLLKRTPELWHWKHTINPFGSSLVFVAESQDRVAGVRALMRWELVTPDGRLIKCARPVDTATHPEFLRRGIFRTLTMTALDAARDEGIQLIFNTPNQKSAPGYLGMGWQSVARLGVLIRPRLGRALRPPSDGAPSIAAIAPSMKALHDIGLMVSDRAPVGLRTPRSEAYLSWRFGAHPTASYGYLEDAQGAGLVGRASERNGQSELVVSDLLGSPSPGLIRAAAHSSRSRYLAGWFAPASPERRIATRGGMLPVPFLRTLHLVALPLTDLGFDVFDLHRWDLSTSDLELL